MTLPMIGGMLSLVVFNLTDLYFVSWLDRGLAQAQYKAAMTFTFPIVQFIFMISLGIGIATASVTSRAIGNGDHHRVQRLTVDALLLTFLMIATVAVLALVFMDPLFTMLNAQQRLLPLIRGYMTVWLIGIPIVVLPMIGNNAIRAAGDTLWPALIMAFAAVVNCVLDPLLIFGVDWLGIPRMEMQGAALATVLSRMITLVASLAILHHKRMLTFERPRWAEVWGSWRELLWIGLPAALTNILWPVAQGVITRIIAGYGENSVAAYGAGSRIEALAMMVLWAMATVLMVFTGQNWTAGRFDRVHRAQRLSRRFALIWGIGCWGLFILFGRAIAWIYAHDNPEVLIKTQMYLMIAPAGYGLRGITFLTARSFSALNKPLDATFVDFIRMFVLYIPMAYLGAYLGDVAGVFIAIAVSNIAAGLVAVAWFGRVQRRLEAEGATVEPVAEAAIAE
jgi:putative MATE family efflux protein